MYAVSFGRTPAAAVTRASAGNMTRPSSMMGCRQVVAHSHRIAPLSLRVGTDMLLFNLRGVFASCPLAHGLVRRRRQR